MAEAERSARTVGATPGLDDTATTVASGTRGTGVTAPVKIDTLAPAEATDLNSPTRRVVELVAMGGPAAGGDADAVPVDGPATGPVCATGVGGLGAGGGGGESGGGDRWDLEGHDRRIEGKVALEPNQIR